MEPHLLTAKLSGLTLLWTWTTYCHKKAVGSDAIWQLFLTQVRRLLLHSSGALTGVRHEHLTKNTTYVSKIIFANRHYQEPAPVALLVASRYALPGYSDQWVWVQGPDWSDHLCQVIAAYDLRFSGRHRSTMVSSLNCDHWLVLGLEAFSH